MWDVEKRWESLLSLALKKKASDIHLTEKGESFCIEMRIEGRMKKVKSMPEDRRLLPYLQYAANLDVGSSILPQTGQFEVMVDNELLSLRFALLRRIHCSNGVVRILNHRIDIDGKKLSRIPSQNALMQKVLRQRSGLILLCGATGSGKTTSLYSLLRSLKDRKIYSLEDPIERYFEEFMQWQINESIGFDYSEGIKQVLRHDPDIVMIGEIRDEKAAKGALRMAETGHLVLSSLHASSVGVALLRMQELGISLEVLLENIQLISCQRLYDIHGEKLVLYEMSEADGLREYLRKREYPSSFLSLEKQEEMLRSRGVAL